MRILITNDDGINAPGLVTLHHIATALGGRPDDAPETLAAWARDAGLPGLTAQGLPPTLHEETAKAALGSSSMKGNPVALTTRDLMAALHAAA